MTSACSTRRFPRMRWSVPRVGAALTGLAPGRRVAILPTFCSPPLTSVVLKAGDVARYMVMAVLYTIPLVILMPARARRASSPEPMANVRRRFS